jgi:cytochrome c553
MRSQIQLPDPVAAVFVTDQLAEKAAVPDLLREKLAIRDLAQVMLDRPGKAVPRLVRTLIAVLGLGLSVPAFPVSAQNLGEPPDTMAARVEACAPCHGDRGQGTSDVYFPRLAGKPAGYLYNQLVAFKNGRRKYPPMNYLLEYLTEPYLHEAFASGRRMNDINQQMRNIGRALTPQEIDEAAAYYASQSPEIVKATD